MYDFEDALDVDLGNGEGENLLGSEQRAIIQKQSISVSGRKRPRSRYFKNQSTLMNRSSNYVLDMLQEEEDDDMEPFTSLKDFGTASLAEFNSLDKLDKLETGHMSARDRGNSGFLKI